MLVHGVLYLLFLESKKNGPPLPVFPVMLHKWIMQSSVLALPVCMGILSHRHKRFIVWCKCFLKRHGLLWSQSLFSSVWSIHFNCPCCCHQLRGYQGTSALALQIFIGTADERLLKPHAFYQVHRITGKTVTTPSMERMINGTKVLEIPLEPKSHMRVVWVKLMPRGVSIIRHKCLEYVSTFHHKSFTCVFQPRETTEVI